MSRTDNPDVPELVDDAVGGDASRQLGRFTLSVSSNEETDMNEVHVGGEINYHVNAANGSSALEFSVENFANNPSGDGSSHGFGIDRGHLSSSFDRTPTESVELMMNSANNLKQIGLAVIHYDGSPSPVEGALDAGECNVDFCARNSPQASPAPVNPRGYAGGHFELVVEGHSALHLSVGESVSGHRLFVGNLSYHYSDDLEPNGIPEFVDDVVGEGTSVLEFSVENFPINSIDAHPDFFWLPI